MSGISLSPVVASLPSASLTPEVGGDSQSFDFANLLGQVMSPVVDASQLLPVAPTLIDRSDGKSEVDDAQTEQASLPVATPDAYTQLMMAMAQLPSSSHALGRAISSSDREADEVGARAGVKRILSLNVQVGQGVQRGEADEEGGRAGSKRISSLNVQVGERVRRGLAGAASDREQPSMNSTVHKVIASADDGDQLVEAGVVEVGANFAALLQDLPQSGDGVSAKPLASVVAEKAASVEQSMPVMGHAGVVEVRQQEGHKELVIDTPVGRPGWGDELGAKVVVVVRDGQQSAEMQLNPPNLGPLEVRLSVQNDQTTLMFVSAHASVREAIQAALPRLSGMFAESGLSMGSVTVGDQSLAQQQQQQQNGQNSKRSYSSSSVADVDLGAGVAEPMVLTRSAWRLSMFV